MDADLSKQVWQRADSRCEYCRLPQSAAPIARFQIEHIRARQHGGLTRSENLALACPRCNCFKGPNLTGIDPETDEITPLYNPRTELWSDHFAVEEADIVGLTAMGRTTAALLRMNDPERVELRTALILSGEF